MKICFRMCVWNYEWAWTTLDKTKGGDNRWGCQVWMERKQVLWVELGEKWTNKIPNFIWNFSASSTNSHFVEKLWGMNMVWTVWTCYELHCISSPVLISSVGKWCWIWGHFVSCRSLSQGRVLKHPLALWIETETFMNEKGKAVAELCDEKWI